MYFKALTTKNEVVRGDLIHSGGKLYIHPIGNIVKVNEQNLSGPTIMYEVKEDSVQVYNIPNEYLSNTPETKYCYSYDGKEFQGTFFSFEEAKSMALIQALRLNLNIDTLYIGERENAELDANGYGIQIAKLLEYNLIERCGEAAESFHIGEEQIELLEDTLKNSIESWAQYCKIKTDINTIVHIKVLKKDERGEFVELEELADGND